jgi:regulator of replication initiation timing
VLKRWALGLSKLKKLLQDSNTVLSIMDKLEENRTLTLQEGNFRRILKKIHLEAAAKSKRLLEKKI